MNLYSKKSSKISILDAKIVKQKLRSVTRAIYVFKAILEISYLVSYIFSGTKYMTLLKLATKVYFRGKKTRLFF